MKIPVMWLQDYVKTDKSPRDIAASFTQLGLMLDKPLEDGRVLDLEHRMDRSDWLSVIGCARDFAAFENLPLLLPKVPLLKAKKPSPSDQIPIRVTCPEIVRRFNTRVFRNVKVGPSPQWLTERLELYGVKSINNVVDITNFVMIEYGQPMHAQDLAKLPAPEITLRRAKKHEKITSFLGTILDLDENMFVLSSRDKPVVLGGIVGGIDTGVTGSTTDLILDAGNYDQRVIRKVSRQLHIANETVLRYDKFLDPRLTEDAINRAAALLVELTGATYYDNVDYYPTAATSKTICMRHSRLNMLSGMNISLNKAKKTLTKLGYSITEESKDMLTLEIPYFRTDVEVEDDCIADILRIGDYTTIPTLPLATPIPVDITPSIYHFEDRLRDSMVAAGCHEHITGSLVPANGSMGQIILHNALTSEQSALRTTIAETLNHVRETYTKHGVSATVFEIGKVFTEKNKKGTYESYTEARHMTALSPTHQESADILATIMNNLGIPYRLSQDNDRVSIITGNKIVGFVGDTSFTLYTDVCALLAKPYGTVLTDYAQSVSLDLSYTIPASISFGEIHEAIIAASPKAEKVILKERREKTILLRIVWPAETDGDHEKSAINIALMAMGLVSRSG